LNRLEGGDKGLIKQQSDGKGFRQRSSKEAKGAGVEGGREGRKE
jgi:hypothetical protein